MSEFGFTKSRPRYRLFEPGLPRRGAGGTFRGGPERSAGIGAALFDVDGVLADTAHLHTAAWRRLADEERLEFKEETAQALRGLSREDSLHRLLGERRVSYDVFAMLLDRKNEYYVASLQALGAADALPGVRELLRDLRAHGVRLAAVSLSRNAMRVLDRVGLLEAFSIVIDGTAQAKARGGLNRYLLAAAALRVQPSRCVVIEDSALGIATARGVGMKTVGIGCGRRLCAADVVLESFDGLSAGALLSRLAGAGVPNEAYDEDRALQAGAILR